MSFEAMKPADLRGLSAINLAYLNFLSTRDAQARRQIEHLPVGAREGLRHLPPEHRKEIAACPFLLCSLADVDVGAGERPPGSLELFPASATRDALVLLMSLSFLRRVAWRRPHAARLMAGVDAEWCSALLGLDDPALTAVAQRQASRLRPVHAAIAAFWTELLQIPAIGPLRAHAVRSAGLQRQLMAPALPLRRAASRLRNSRRKRDRD